MSQATYFMEIECLAVPSALHDTQVVTVTDADGNEQYLRVARGFLTAVGGRAYLPIRVVELDRSTGRALVQLPYEADSGMNRLWVKLDQFRRAEGHQPAGNVA